MITEDAVGALYASGEFDPDYYLDAYPDVSQSGLDPAVHFLWIGARLGRLRKAPKGLMEGSRDGCLDVLFVDGTNGTSSTPYRVDRVAQALSERGLKIRSISGDELGAPYHQSIRARYVTFFRAPLWEAYGAFAEMMRARGSRIVFDIDDLVFDEDLVPIVDGYRLLTEPEKLGYVRGVRAYRDFLLYADFCTAPTEFLAEQMQALGKKAFLVRNTLADEEIRKFNVSRPSLDKPRFVVGYYSGSRTHQADFRNAGEALADFMEENPLVDFRLVGQFDLREYPRLHRWTEGEPQGRVRQFALMPHSQMLEDQLKCDLIIAPLEVENPFCEAKSELKFFEASLARRPVIASPTRTFARATRNGRYGLLAASRGEWLNAYRFAFGNREALRDQADLAFKFATREYAPAAAGADVIEAYSETLHSPKGWVAGGSQPGSDWLRHASR